MFRQVSQQSGFQAVDHRGKQQGRAKQEKGEPRQISQDDMRNPMGSQGTPFRKHCNYFRFSGRGSLCGNSLNHSSMHHSSLHHSPLHQSSLQLGPTRTSCEGLSRTFCHTAYCYLLWRSWKRGLHCMRTCTIRLSSDDVMMT